MDDDNPSTSMTSVHFHTHIVSHDECEEGGEGGEEERAAGNVAGGGDDTGGEPWPRGPSCCATSRRTLLPWGTRRR